MSLFRVTEKFLWPTVVSLNIAIMAGEEFKIYAFQPFLGRIRTWCTVAHPRRIPDEESVRTCSRKKTSAVLGHHPAGGALHLPGPNSPVVFGKRVEILGRLLARSRRSLPRLSPARVLTLRCPRPLCALCRSHTSPVRSSGRA